ncbi:adenylyl-sulfate kinase, partial [Nocardioides massiliensis]
MSLPQHCPSARELDDLELFAVGALAPARFESADGVLTLVVPDAVGVAAVEAGTLELVEPEGTPIARVTVESTYPAPAGTGIVGSVETLARNEVGPFRRLYLTPVEVAAQHPDAVTVPVTAPLTSGEIEAIRDRAAGRPVALLALAGVGTPVDTDPIGLIRSTLSAAEQLSAAVVAVPLASHGDAEADHALGTTVVAAYAPGEILALPTPADDAESTEQPEASRGVVVFFTGLSGSGKSTIARALTDVVLESGARSVTSLDGDIVRRNLSAGLTFSKEDRETNIRRIGWV